NLVVFTWIGNDGTLDTITDVLSHEVVEATTDPQQGNGITVTLGASWPYGGDDQIADAEAENYSARLNGYLVQSYWSQQDQAYLVPTGQAQNFFVTNGVLTVQGDQLGTSFSDTVLLSKTSAGGVQVTLNGETATFDTGDITAVHVSTGGGADT